MKRKAVIISGGFGTRLAPRTTTTPKQFQDLLGSGRSMIQLTAERLHPLAGNDITVVTNGVQARWVGEQLPSAHLVLEPVARNTAPAIGLAAIEMEPDDIMMVFPADHVFKDEQALCERLHYAAELAAERDALVTIGIVPTHPHTGLGHIERGAAIDEARGAFQAARFVEKPPLAEAKKYVESGRFYWNAGIFCWSAGRFLRSLAEHAPAMHQGLLAIRDGGDVSRLFPALPNLSVDYALMERAAADTIVLAGQGLGWLDIGDWCVWGQAIGRDAAGNAVQGRVELVECRDCIAYNDDPQVALQLTGLHDLVVARAEGRLLICPAAAAQQVGKSADLFAACPNAVLNLGAQDVQVVRGAAGVAVSGV